MARVAWTHGDGPLTSFAEGYRRELVQRGYRPGAAKEHVLLMGQLNRWLAREGLGVGGLTEATVEAFLCDLRAGGRRRVPAAASVAPLLDHLRSQGTLPAATLAKPTPRDELLARYHHHLVQGRGLLPTTVLRYERFASRFLAQRASRTGGAIGTEDLTSAEVNAFLLEASARLVVESAKREAADLRALLRFLYLERILGIDLGSAMPPVASWRGTRLPRTLSAADVGALLRSCDRSMRGGRRDYAILNLLAGLGLRAGEVAALQLGDVDWRAGEITVRGKARRQDRLPLPIAVGESLAAYLHDGRPSGACARLILTLRPPPRPIHPSSITNVVYRACRRAGLARVGGHRLRHALATEMLRRGGNLVEIAQVLRHSDLGTTAGYAKVDRVVLRAVALSWPGAGR